jgi:hypothetical protein
MSLIAQHTGAPELPPVVTLHHPEAFDVWAIYRAFDRRFLPSQILEESSAWIDDMLALDGLFEALKPKESE